MQKICIACEFTITNVTLHKFSSNQMKNYMIKNLGKVLLSPIQHQLLVHVGNSVLRIPASSQLTVQLLIVGSPTHISCIPYHFVSSISTWQWIQFSTHFNDDAVKEMLCFHWHYITHLTWRIWSEFSGNDPWEYMSSMNNFISLVTYANRFCSIEALPCDRFFFLECHYLIKELQLINVIYFSSFQRNIRIFYRWFFSFDVI